MGTGTGEPPSSSSSIHWVDPNASSVAAEVATEKGESDAASTDSIDLEFEWVQLCHGCGERKRFNALICDDCQERHQV